MSCNCDNTLTLSVVSNNAVTTATASPVNLGLDMVVPVSCCFDVCISKSLLVNCNTSLVNFTFGANTYPLYDEDAIQVRWDQLVNYGSCVCKCGRITLHCRAYSDGRIFTYNCLPDSSYLAPAAKAAESD